MSIALTLKILNDACEALKAQGVVLNDSEPVVVKCTLERAEDIAEFFGIELDLDVAGEQLIDRFLICVTPDYP